MNTAMAIPGNTAATFLIHFFGSGLEDTRCAVERFKAQADGDIRPTGPEAPKPNGRRVGNDRKFPICNDPKFLTLGLSVIRRAGSTPIGALTL